MQASRHVSHSNLKFDSVVTKDVRWGRLSFAVGDPDVFDLGGVLEEEAAFGLGGVEPVDVAAFVCEGLF